MSEKPTIEDLEKLLNEPDKKVIMNPDGSITVEDKDSIISDLRRQLDDYKNRYAASERKAKDNLDYAGELLKQLSEVNKEIGRLKKVIERVYPKHRHDHDYWHDDCGLCQLEKRNYEDALRDVKL